MQCPRCPGIDPRLALMGPRTYPISNYCVTIHSDQSYTPSSGYRKHRRIQAQSGTCFDYHEPRALSMSRTGDFRIVEETPTQKKYAAVNMRVRERSKSRSRASISSDRWSICQGDIAALPESRDIRLARKRMSSIEPSNFEEYPPIRARSNQYEAMTHSMIHSSTMRHLIM